MYARIPIIGAVLALLTLPVLAAPGDVSLTVDPSAVAPGGPVDVRVMVDTGPQLLNAYTLTVTYDPSRLALNGGASAVIGGPQALAVRFANEPNPGTLRLTGFDLSGRGPSDALHILTIPFIASSSVGPAQVGVSIDALSQASPGIGHPVTIRVGESGPVTYPLSVSLTGIGTGTVSSDPAGIDCGGDCTFELPEDSQVTLTASPAAGSRFAGWSGACSGMGLACNLTLDAALSAQARFEKQNWTLSVTRAGDGQGRISSAPMGIDCGSDCSESYVDGTTVTLTAIAEPGSELAGWGGACAGSGATCTLTLGASENASATFNLIPSSGEPGVNFERIDLGYFGDIGDFGWDFAVSDDGRFVAFDSGNDLLVVDDFHYGSDVFVHDRVLGTTELVSRSSNGAIGNDDSYFTSMSPDGRYIVFTSFADNLVSGDTNGTHDVFVRDRQAGVTHRVSIGSSGIQGNDSSDGGEISANGSRVLFHSSADNLVPGDTNGTLDVFVHDLTDGQTRRVSVATDGTQGDDRSAFGSISRDGRYAAFHSDAGNLDDDAFSGYSHVYRHDLQTGETLLVDAPTDGGLTLYATIDFPGLEPSLSADGRFVTFPGRSWNLHADDGNSPLHIFLRDMESDEIEVVSVNDAGTGGDAEGGGTSFISADGRYVLFDSESADLVADDTNEARDVFLRDRQSSRTYRLSVGPAGEQADPRNFIGDLSGDGRFALFQSEMSNLTTDDTNGVGDLFVAEIEVGSGLPPVDLSVVPGVPDTGCYGYNWPGCTGGYRDAFTIGFESTGEPLLLQVTGYDIDYADEVQVLLDGEISLGWLPRSPNNGLAEPHVIELAGDLIPAGEHTLTFVQRTSGFRWGVTDLSLALNDGCSTYALTQDATDPSGFGWRFGSGADRDGLAATFVGDGRDRLLHVTGYDVDFGDELAVLLNGERLGYLARTDNNALGRSTLFYLPASLQVAGKNCIELVQRTPGFIWGVQNLGIYSLGSAFGNLRTLSGGDRSHGEGFDLVIPDNEDGWLLELTPYDSDWDDEIGIALGGSDLAGFPKGLNNDWGHTERLILPGAWLGDPGNRLTLGNRDNPGYVWGVRIGRLVPMDQVLGHRIPGLPDVDSAIDVARYLVPGSDQPLQIDLIGYDVDFGDEIEVRLDGASIGFLSKGPNNAWADAVSFQLPASDGSVLEVVNTYNPTRGFVWGIAIGGLWSAE